MTPDNTAEKTLEHAPIGIYRSVPEGYFIYANPEMARLFGCVDVDDFLKFYTNIATEFYADDATRDVVVHHLQEHGYVTDFECRCRRRDGSIVWVMESARIVYDARGQPVAYEGFFQDIDRRKQAEESYRRAMEEAQAASRAKSEFLAAMSHELRTPLNAILGFSEILRDEHFGAHAVPIYREYAGDVHDSAAHLETLIDDVLDLAKVEAGELSCECRPEPLGEVVEQCRRLVAARAQRHGVHLATSVDEPDARVLADASRLKQAVTNLLANAIKFAGCERHVWIETNVHAEGVDLAICDDGPGMDDHQLDRALQRFKQAHDDRSRNLGGVGLGLPLAKQLVELQDGGFAIDSRPGEGTRARIRLERPSQPSSASARS